MQKKASKSIKIYSIFFILLITYFPLSAKSSSDTQIINSDSNIYNDFEILCSMAKQSLFIQNKPISVGEFKFYLKQIEYETLEKDGKFLYEKIKNELNKNEDFFKDEEFRLFLNIKINPELYYRTNNDVDFTFNRYLQGYPLEIPIILGFSNYITIESDFFLGKNYPKTHEMFNFTNIPLNGSDLEFNFPKYAYGSTGITFEKWGINFHVGKEGVELGHTKLGSIIYNSTFETDFYSQLNIYTSRVKYLMTVAQIQPEKYLYLHQLDILPFNSFKLSLIEGSLLNSNFELRYLNPLMIMHSFGSWFDYEKNMKPIEFALYEEGQFCAYLALAFEWMPIKNLRIYGLYSQNEILDFGGGRDDYSLSFPDSLGGQIGINYIISLPNNSQLDMSLEAVYTSPFLYVKQSPDWSLNRTRVDVQTKQNIETWLGSPFGPNSFAIQFYSEYNTQKRWNCGIGYLFKIQGKNPLKDIKKVEVPSYTDIFGNTYSGEVYDYYPSVEYKLAENDEQRIKAKNKGRYMWMQGIKEYSNIVYIKGNFDLTENISLNGKLAFSYIICNKNILNKNDFSFEVDFGCSYKLFK